MALLASARTSDLPSDTGGASESSLKKTKAAYTASKRGGAEDCECAGCRNLVAQRAVEYPLELRKFLESVGVDPFKEAEVCEYPPLEDGCSLYQGW